MYYHFFLRMKMFPFFVRGWMGFFPSSCFLGVFFLFGLENLAKAQTVTVTNGWLGLQTAPGSTNDLWANPPDANSVFDHWTGSIGIVADPHAWHTTVTMPPNGTTASLTPLYKSSPAWNTSTFIVNGLQPTDPNAVNFIYYVPPNPAGLVIFLHGTGGSAANFFSHVETFAFARDAVGAGYAIAALDSNDRVNAQWSNEPDTGNVDIVNIQTCLNYLTGLGLINANTPLFVAGMSDGGDFAPYAAYVYNCKGCAIWCSGGNNQMTFTTTLTPTIWCLAQYDDDYLHTSFLSIAQSNLSSLTSRGIAGSIHEHPASPVYPGRFLRIPGLAQSDSESIYNSLQSNGFLDANNYLVSDPTTNGWQNTALTQAYVPYFDAIEQQLAACFTQHVQYSDYDDLILQSFNPNAYSLSFSQWEAANGISSGPAATPENDGVPNLLKYLCHINPAVHMTSADRAAMPVFDSTTLNGTRYLTLTYRQYAYETGITINAQTSPDLKNWTTVTNPSIVQTGNDPVTGDPIVQVQVPASGSKEFIRLNVTMP
jgi:hypothetical protein